MDIIKIKLAAETAKSKTNNKRWVAAIDKAVAGASTWIITELQHCIVITTESEKTYRVNAQHCQCEAFFNNQPCKHRALFQLIARAEEMEAAPVAPTRSDVISDIKARWPKDVNLADELMRRFKRNSLEMLSIDFLTAIRAAI